MTECPHLEACHQNIVYSDFFLCMGKVPDWDFDSCFESDDLGENEAMRLEPREWKKENGER